MLCCYVPTAHGMDSPGIFAPAQVETLRRELAQLEQSGRQLEGEIEQRGEAHLQEIEGLEVRGWPGHS